MRDKTTLSEEFERERDRLLRLAVGILSARSDAEDAVQDLWLRLAKQNADKIENLAGWLTTSLTRICLDQLRRRRARQSATIGNHLSLNGSVIVDPEAEFDERQAIGLALSLILSTLDPAERMCIVLHDVYGIPFAEIAIALKRSPSSTRQLASRGRRRLLSAKGVERLRAASEQLALADRYLIASQRGDLASVVRLLDPNATLKVELDGIVTTVLGAQEVASRAIEFRARASQVEVIFCDGKVALGRFARGTLKTVMFLTFEQDRIVAMEIVTSRECITTEAIVRRNSRSGSLEALTLMS